MYYTIKHVSPYKAIHLPLDVENKLSAMSEDEVKILILCHALASKNASEGFEEEEALEFLALKGYDRDRAMAALAYLRGAGYFDGTPGGARAKRPAAKQAVRYEAHQLTDAMNASADFAALRDYFEARLNKMLNTSELAVIYSFLDSLRLSPDVIMLVGEYCINENKASLRYIEKTLLDLVNKDITGYEAVEKHIAGIKEYKSYEGKIRNICGFGSRALTKKETELIGKWKNVYGADLDMVALAYEKTVDSIKNPSLAYMDKILDGWKRSGFSGAEDVKKAENGQKSAGDGKSFDSEDFFKAAVARSRGNK